MKPNLLTLRERQALARLYEESKPKLHGLKGPVFPGAIGSAGTGLVRKGYAKRIGREIYANNRPEMGERPDAYVRFEITDSGRRKIEGKP